MSDKTMHLKAGTVQNIKYTTLTFLSHIPIFIVQENIILINPLTAIIWACQKYDKVDTTYIKNERKEQYTHSEVSAGIRSNWKKETQVKKEIDGLTTMKITNVCSLYIVTVANTVTTRLTSDPANEFFG
jgi:hypothetical protein